MVLTNSRKMVFFKMIYRLIIFFGLMQVYAGSSLAVASATPSNGLDGEPLELRYDRAQRHNHELRKEAKDVFGDVALKANKERYVEYLRNKNAKLKSDLSEVSQVLKLPLDQQEAKLNELLQRLRNKNVALKNEMAALRRQGSDNEMQKAEFNEARRQKMLQKLGGSSVPDSLRTSAQALDNVAQTEGEVGQNQFKEMKRQQIMANKGLPVEKKKSWLSGWFKKSSQTAPTATTETAADQKKKGWLW